MAQPFLRGQGLAHKEQQVQMVGHEGDLPQLHLWIDGVYLWQLFVEDGAAEDRRHQVGEGIGAPLRPYVALYVSEDGLAPLYAERHHIQPRARIVGPRGAAVLVVLGLCGRDAQALQIFPFMVHILLSYRFYAPISLLPCDCPACFHQQNALHKVL